MVKVIVIKRFKYYAYLWSLVKVTSQLQPVDISDDIARNLFRQMARGTRFVFQVVCS